MIGAIAARIVGLAAAVAVVVALVASVIAYPLINNASVSQARQALANLTDLTAAALDRGPGRRGNLLPRGLEEILVAEEIRGYVIVDAETAVIPGFDRELAEGVLSGEITSIELEARTGVILVEARRLISGAAVVLTQSVAVAGGVTASVTRQFAIALGLGLILAVFVGVVVARRIARPLRDAQAAANAMAAGSRDVRLEPAGATEVADIAVALNRLSASLDASERRQREFLLSVSHELRTPLTGLQGFGEAMADGLVVESADVRSTGVTIAHEARRLNRLVTDLLDLGRAGAVDFHVTVQRIDLGALTSEAAAAWLDRCAREGITITLAAPQGSVLASGDPVRVRQIIDNLVENALRVSPVGSSIVLAVAVTDDGPALQVRDSGPGLTDDDCSVAFEPGTLHERYRGIRPVGTGLGLALVGRLAARMGGSAEAGRAPEGGACFTVRLPAAGDAPST